jgi:2'-5' RNA ligase
MLRLFIAIDFPDEINQQLIALCRGIDKAKWIKPGQVHLTMRVIGDSFDDQTELLKLALREIEQPAFEITLQGVGTFPPPDKRGRPKVLWVGIKEGSPLLEYQQKIEQAVQNAGYKPEERPFHPHVTLARFRKHPGKELEEWLQKHKEFQAGPIQVNELHLISSKLTPDGAIHKAIESFPLKPGGGEHPSGHSA